MHEPILLFGKIILSLKSEEDEKKIKKFSADHQEYTKLLEKLDNKYIETLSSEKPTIESQVKVLHIRKQIADIEFSLGQKLKEFMDAHSIVSG